MNLSSLSKDAKARIGLISLSGKLGFTSFIILSSIIIYFLIEKAPMPILGAIIVIACLSAFMPYFLLKSRYEKWYLNKINPLVVGEVNKKGINVHYEQTTLSKENINACNILQNVDLVEGGFVITIKSQNKVVRFSKINCYNYVHHKISNKDIKEGRRLPVFEGIFMSINLNNKDSLSNITLMSQNIPRSDSSFSTLRLQNELYKDGKKVKIKGYDFYQYSTEVESNSINIVEDIIDIQKMLELSKYLIIGLSNNSLFIIYPGTEYFQISTDKRFVEESINRDHYFLDNLLSALKIA